MVLALEDPGDVVRQLPDGVANGLFVRIFHHEEFFCHLKSGIFVGSVHDVAYAFSRYPDNSHDIRFHRLDFFLYLARENFHAHIGHEGILRCRHDGEHDLFKGYSAHV